MKARAGQKLKLTSYDELLGGNGKTEEGSVEIQISKIQNFRNHPFRVVDDDKMLALTESILENGIVTPVLVRPLEEGRYEMISGHRRLRAAQLAGLSTLPAIIREMSDEEATIVMVDSVRL